MNITSVTVVKFGVTLAASRAQKGHRKLDNLATFLIKIHFGRNDVKGLKSAIYDVQIFTNALYLFI